MNICIDCKNAYVDKCSWVNDCTPVEGCKFYAKRENKIKYCPNFESDKKAAVYEEGKCPECGSEVIQGNSRKKKKFCSTECCKRYHSREWQRKNK